MNILRQMIIWMDRTTFSRQLSGAHTFIARHTSSIELGTGEVCRYPLESLELSNSMSCGDILARTLKISFVKLLISSKSHSGETSFNGSGFERGSFLRTKRFLVGWGSPALIECTECVCGASLLAPDRMPEETDRVDFESNSGNFWRVLIVEAEGACTEIFGTDDFIFGLPRCCCPCWLLLVEWNWQHAIPLGETKDTCTLPSVLSRLREREFESHRPGPLPVPEWSDTSSGGVQLSRETNFVLRWFSLFGNGYWTFRWRWPRFLAHGFRIDRFFVTRILL
jgi:hypothetical protein